MLSGSGPFWVYFTIGADWNVWQWSGASQNAIFSSKSHIPGSVRSYITRYCEGPGEQPGMTLVLPLTYERALYHKAVHPLACLLNALQYQLNENLQRPAAAALRILQ